MRRVDTGVYDDSGAMTMKLASIGAYNGSDVKGSSVEVGAYNGDGEGGGVR